MIAEVMVFLVMLVPETDRPPLVLFQSFETVKECNVILDMAPADQRNRWACMKIDVKPREETTPL
jgi:hypothetical protein